MHSEEFSEGNGVHKTAFDDELYPLDAMLFLPFMIG